jgi:4-amino-4-deoxy-L-arabinose transferase-like glycosyltransferase
MLRPAQLLRHDRFAAWLSAYPLQLALAICLVWVFMGLVGHDPWKPDEAHAFGVVYRLIEHGGWLVPSLAGEPYLERPALVYLSSALAGIAFSPLLALHDAARLSTGFWMALVFAFTALSARELWGGNRTWLAPLMLLGCVGLLVRGHQLVSDVILLAGFAIAIYGLAMAPRRHLPAGIWLGLGLGLAVFSSGLFEPVMLLLMIVGIMIISPLYRTGRFALTLVVALAVALPIALAWPVALYLQAPEHFADWFWNANVARLRELFVLRKHDEFLYYLEILPWFAWPAWPFALWSLWVERGQGLRKREMQLPLVAFVAMIGFLSLAGEGRDILGLPLLIPLALLASFAIDRVPRGGVNAFYWFGIMVVTVFAIVGWVYFSAIEYGTPAWLADQMYETQPAYEPNVHPIAIGAAAMFTALWLALVFNLKRSPERPVILWGAGLTIGWTLVVLLLFPWIDTGKTYRGVIGDLTEALPANHGCLYSRGLGEPQRAMLDYFGNLTTVRMEAPGDKPTCDLLITQDNWRDTSAMGMPWELIWEGRRPGDNQERYRIYRRLPS